MHLNGLKKLLSITELIYPSHGKMVETILKKAIEGDRSMIIDADREALGTDKKRLAMSDEDSEHTSKRQRVMSELKLETLKVELGIKQAEARALKIENDRKEMENKKQQIQDVLDNHTKALDVYTQLCNKGGIDNATRKLFTTPLLNLVTKGAVAESTAKHPASPVAAASSTNGSVAESTAKHPASPVAAASSTNGSVAESTAKHPASPVAAASSNRITVSGVATEMGFPGLCANELKLIGTGMAKRYREKYNENPPQYQQKIGCGFGNVNLYMERDKDMMIEEIQKVHHAAAGVGGAGSGP